MITKENGRGKRVKVTFELPMEVQADSAFLVGDFNDWNESANPMQHDGNNTYSTTLELEKGREYQFRYLINGTEWHNDWQADKYQNNPFGGDNSVVVT